MCSQELFNPKGELMSYQDFALVQSTTNFVARKLRLAARTTHYVRSRIADMEPGDHINVGFTGLQVYCRGGLPYGQRTFRVIFDDSWK